MKVPIILFTDDLVCSRHSIDMPHNNLKVDIAVPVLQMRKQRIRKVKFAQGRSTGK